MSAPCSQGVAWLEAASRLALRKAYNLLLLPHQVWEMSYTIGWNQYEG